MEIVLYLLGIQCYIGFNVYVVADFFLNFSIIPYFPAFRDVTFYIFIIGLLSAHFMVHMVQTKISTRMHG